MNWRRFLVVVLALLVGVSTIALGGPIGNASQANAVQGPAQQWSAAGMSNDTGNGMTDPSEPNVSTVIAVQGAAVDQSVELAAFESRLDDADGANETAAVIGDELDRIDDRLADLEARLERARTARQNGSLSQAGFEMRVRPIVASASSLDARMRHLQQKAEAIDPGVLRAADVTEDRLANVTARLDAVLSVDAGRLGSSTLEHGFYRSLAEAVVTHNEGEEIDLGALGSHVNGERINLHVTTQSGETAVVSFRTTDENEVRELRAGKHPAATLRVTTDEGTARRVLEASDPGAATSRAFLDGEIEVDGIGWVNALKWLLLSTVMEAIRIGIELVGVVQVRA